jgi:hypothetical protein
MNTKNNNKEANEQSRQKERKEEAQVSLPSSLSASGFSEVINASVNPFSQPMFVADLDRPARREDYQTSSVTEANKSEMVKGSEVGQLQKPDHQTQEMKSGKNTISAPSSNITDAKPYNYTIDGETHEIFFTGQEVNAALEPVEKVTVLKHSLVPFITTGDVIMPRASVLQVNGKSFELARQLFELNPFLPVSSLLQVLWECNKVACENPVKESGFKPCFTHRAATESLTYLLKNLDTINGTMPEDLRLPDNTAFLIVE